MVNESNVKTDYINPCNLCNPCEIFLYFCLFKIT